MGSATRAAAYWLGALALAWAAAGWAAGGTGSAGTGASADAGHAGVPRDSNDPRAWLLAADRALTTRNYRGVFVHEYGGETETLRVVHRAGGDGPAERLQSMDGSGREFIRRGDKLYCYLPDRHTVLVENSPDTGLLLGGLLGGEATLSGSYTVRELARARVSGRTTRVIAIVPMDQLRYGYQIWIDEATAMPLKMQLRTARGRVLEQIVFTELVLPARIASSELDPAVDARHYRWVQQGASSASADGAPSGPALFWQPAALPPGFRMTVSTRQMLPGGPAQHMVFSDGLASVSVFVQRRSGERPRADDQATLGISSAYSVAIEGYRVTVVGEVPPQTVRRIALAMRPSGPGAAAAEPSALQAPATSPLPALLPSLGAPAAGSPVAPALLSTPQR